MKKPERRSVKWTMALTPSEARAIKWHAKGSGYRGLAALRLMSVANICEVYRSLHRKRVAR
jgi:hypothetical protein